MFETISNTVSVRYKISHPDWFGVLRIIQVMIIHRFKFQQTLGRTNTTHPHVVAAAKAYYHHMHLHKHWQGHMFTCQKHIPQIHWPLKGQARPGKVSHHTLKCNSTPDSTTLFGFPFVRSVVHLFILHIHMHTCTYDYVLQTSKTRTHTKITCSIPLTPLGKASRKGVIEGNKTFFNNYILAPNPPPLWDRKRIVETQKTKPLRPCNKPGIISSSIDSWPRTFYLIFVVNSCIWIFHLFVRSFIHFIHSFTHSFCCFLSCVLYVFLFSRSFSLSVFPFIDSSHLLIRSFMFSFIHMFSCFHFIPSVFLASSILIFLSFGFWLFVALSVVFLCFFLRFFFPFLSFFLVVLFSLSLLLFCYFLFFVSFLFFSFLCFCRSFFVDLFVGFFLSFFHSFRSFIISIHPFICHFFSLSLFFLFFIHSLTQSIIHSFIHAFLHSLVIHSFIRSLPYSLIHSFFFISFRSIPFHLNSCHSFNQPCRHECIRSVFYSFSVYTHIQWYMHPFMHGLHINLHILCI